MKYVYPSDYQPSPQCDFVFTYSDPSDITQMAINILFYTHQGNHLLSDYESEERENKMFI